MSKVLRVARYRFRATFARRWGGYLSVVVLIGLVGGLAMGSLAGARRTQSSFPTFLASTDPSDMTIFTGPLPLAVIAHLPGVKQVESISLLDAVLLGTRWSPSGRRDANRQVSSVGSVNGLRFKQNRLTVVAGRMANPSRDDQAVVTEEGARLLGVHVGQTVSVGFYTNAETMRSGFGTVAVQPHIRLAVTVVRIVVPNSEVVQDDASRSISALLIFTTALTSRVEGCCGEGLEQYGIQLDRSHGNVTTVETKIEHALPSGAAFYITNTSDIELEAQ